MRGYIKKMTVCASIVEVNFLGIFIRNGDQKKKKKKNKKLSRTEFGPEAPYTRTSKDRPALEWKIDTNESQ